MFNLGPRLLRGLSISSTKRLQSSLAVAASKKRESPSNGFLPEAYACSQQWHSYLQQQTNEYKVKSSNASELLIAAKDHAVKGGKFYELDIDTLALAIGNGFYDESELDIFERYVLPAFRKGPQASRWLASTPAIITRTYADRKYFKRLRNLIGNKNEFGVFPDHVSYASLLNALLSQGQHEDAAFFAAEWMLQEEQSVSKLANGMSLLACWQRALQIEKCELSLPVPGEESEEEQVIRVNFLINPYNDLHFDLVSEHHRVGKTLFILGQLHGNTNCSLVGTALFENFRDSLGLIKSSKDQLSGEAFDKFEQLLGLAETKEDAQARWKPTMDQHIDRVLVERKISKDERTKLVEEAKAVRESLAKSGRLVKDAGVVSSQIGTLIHNAADEECRRDVSVREKQLSKEWPEIRKKLASEQVFEAGRAAAIVESRLSLGELRDKLETLSYFEKLDELGVRQAMGEEAVKKAEEDKVLKEKERKSRRWQKPEVKFEEARANVGIYPVTGV